MFWEENIKDNVLDINQRQSYVTARQTYVTKRKELKDAGKSNNEIIAEIGRAPYLPEVDGTTHANWYYFANELALAIPQVLKFFNSLFIAFASEEEEK